MQHHDITPLSPDEVTMVAGAGGGPIRIVDPIIIPPVGPRRPPRCWHRPDPLAALCNGAGQVTITNGDQP